MKTIGILTAMDVETKAIVQLCENVQTVQQGPTLFYECKVNDTHVIIALCGVGKVNAAMTATNMLVHYPIDVLINIGTAGGLQAHLNVLDAIVATQICEYDLDVYDWGKGFDVQQVTTTFDSSLIEHCKQVLNDDQHKIYYGPIATGDTFVCKQSHIDNILNAYPTSLACEMEGASIAKVAKSFQVNCLVIRSLSDIAIKEGNEIDFDHYAQLASQRAAKWCIQLIESFN